MSINDAASQRLFVDADLSEGRRIAATLDQANYLRNVLRSADGSAVLVFNGRDGEWRARLKVEGKRGLILIVEAATRDQTAPGKLHYLFAPLKRSRLDYMVQKAVEMGVSRLCPVLTERTIAERVNLDRMRANAIEAAEQCGVLSIPDVIAPASLTSALAQMGAERRVVFCDEDAALADPLAALATIPEQAPIAVLIGPEGGFSAQEREAIRARAGTVVLSLGPRIMRADTAAVAALALVQAVLGDWRSAPG